MISVICAVFGDVRRGGWGRSGQRLGDGSARDAFEISSARRSIARAPETPTAGEGEDGHAPGRGGEAVFSCVA
jgi:hypothetical protein